MQALKVITAAMGVAIIAGTVLLAVLILHRLAPGRSAAGPALLHEPAGSRIASITAANGVLMVLLQGGGADRIVLLDPRTLRETGRLTLGRAAAPTGP